MIMLNVGCGEDYKIGYINIDINEATYADKHMDITKLEYSDGTVDEIFARSVLEHFRESASVLKEWYRVLKSGGFLHVIVPNIEYWASAYVNNRITDEEFIWRMYGSQSDPTNFHHIGFTANLIKHSFINAGFDALNITTEYDDSSLVCKAYK
jgi:predicted SAM-dependent methyltransferase